MVAAVAVAVARVVAAVVVAVAAAAVDAPAATARAVTAGARARAPAAAPAAPAAAAVRAAEAPLADVLIAGATGLIGHALVQGWAGPGTLHLLVRRPFAPPVGACQVHVVDFSHLPGLPRAEEAWCCLGTTIAQAGSQAAFRAVDLDAVVSFAQAARAAGVSRFGVVSALGASPESRTFYNRVKGDMEAAVAAIGFDRLVIARPSLLAGDRSALQQPTRPGERLALAMSGPIQRWIPAAWRPIHPARVARALRVALAQPGPRTTILESADLQRLGKAPGAD